MGLFTKTNGAGPAATPAIAAGAKLLSEAGVRQQSQSPMHAFAPAYIDLKLRLHQQMLENMNLSVIDKMPQEQIRREVGELVKELLGKEAVPLNSTERTQLVTDIFDEFLGLGLGCVLEQCARGTDEIGHLEHRGFALGVRDDLGFWVAGLEAD